MYEIIDTAGRLENSNFGSYDTRTLSDIYNTSEALKTDYESFFEADAIINFNIIYSLLMGRYADSHIKSYSEDKFRAQVCGIIFQYAPTVFKRNDIQKKLRALTEDEIVVGNTSVFNHAAHDASQPNTQSTWETPYINDQNVNKIKKSKINAYADLYAILEDNIFDEFLNKFKKLFVSFGPGYSLYYKTHTIEGEI
jgi:hypothetical protein